MAKRGVAQRDDKKPFNSSMNKGSWFVKSALVPPSEAEGSLSHNYYEQPLSDFREAISVQDLGVMLWIVQALLSYDRVSKKLLSTPVSAGPYEISFLLPDFFSKIELCLKNQISYAVTLCPKSAPHDEISIENMCKDHHWIMCIT